MSELIDQLKSVKVMFDTMEDLSLGYVPKQIKMAEDKIAELDAIDINGHEDLISICLTPEEKHAIIKLYCFVPGRQANHKYYYLRV